MILEVRGTSRRPNPLVDDDNVPEDMDEITFDHRGHDDRDKDHEGKESQEPVPVRMSNIVPRTATEEAWRSMYVTRRLIIQYGETPGCPGCRSIGEKKGPSHSTECRQRLQNEMSTTRGQDQAGRGEEEEICLHSQKDDVGITRSSRRKSQKQRRTRRKSTAKQQSKNSIRKPILPTAPSCKTSQNKDRREQTQRVKQT